MAEVNGESCSRVNASYESAQQCANQLALETGSPHFVRPAYYLADEDFTTFFLVEDNSKIDCDAGQIFSSDEESFARQCSHMLNLLVASNKNPQHYFYATFGDSFIVLEEPAK